METAINKGNRQSLIDQCPNHWKVLRNKWLFTEIEERSENGDEDLLSVSHYTGVTLKRDNLESETDLLTNSETLEGYKKVAKGYLVINIMLAWNGSLGISPYDGITSPAYCVYRCKGENNPEYFGYLFSTDFYKTEFKRNSTGIIESRLRLYSDNFFDIKTVVPPKVEQDVIVQYIKRKSAQIQAFIQKKRRFIELLKEQRSAIINEAVTKGINMDVKMKDSGIKWLGEVPAHWEIRRLKFCVQLNSTEVDIVNANNIFKLALENIESFSGKYIPSKNEFSFEGMGNHFKPGDVLFNKLRPYLAKVYLAKKKGTSVGELLVLSPVTSILTSEFLFYRLLSSAFIEVVNSSTYGAKRPRANWSFIGNLKLPIPTLAEQYEIIGYIESERARIELLISKAEKEIELIKEYREALIAEAVTGKRYNQ